MSLRKVDILSVPVSDQKRAKDFYTKALGFEVVRDNAMGPDQRWIQVAPKGAETSMTLVTWFESMPPGSLAGLVLETDDIEADVEVLGGRGVVFDGSIETAPWGRYVTFKDPDGNELVLQEPPRG